jgi:hypothetical protein
MTVPNWAVGQDGAGGGWGRGGERRREGEERVRESVREREILQRIWAQAGQGCELRNYAPFVVAWNGGREGGGGGAGCPGRLRGKRHDQADEQEQE